jgi:transposase
MISVKERAEIRHAYYHEKKSMREIVRESGHSWRTVKKAIESAGPVSYTLSEPRPAPKLGPYMERIEEMLAENETLPAKQQYTGRRIYEIIKEEGYPGSASGVRRYVGKRRRERRKRAVFLKLAFDPGQNAQMDWGEAEVIMRGMRVKVQMFVMRLGYSRRTLVQAYPSQRQECFFDGHVRAFEFFGGVPRTISYDNLKTAVYKILTGRKRDEQEAFTLFRSHSLFESHYCTPGKGHEKGSVEHLVGYARRAFFVPLPEVESFEELNAYLWQCCLAEDERVVTGQPRPIGKMWAEEQPHFFPLPTHDLPICVSREVSLTPYGQVVFETNRYSVPVEFAYPQLTLRAYPFAIDILHEGQLVVRHPRCYDRDQDIIDPLHYLPLLKQRPGAFEHADAIRQWRVDWPPVYETFFAGLKRRFDTSEAVRQFVDILSLNRDHPSDQVVAALSQALEAGMVNADAVRWHLKQLLHPPQTPSPLDMRSRPHLASLGQQPLNLSGYDQLLEGGSNGD